jgi:hypothetical protein
VRSPSTASITPHEQGALAILNMRFSTGSLT